MPGNGKPKGREGGGVPEGRAAAGKKSCSQHGPKKVQTARGKKDRSNDGKREEV